jgi:hypothetical protein
VEVGRTVPSFRIAAEIERTKWRQFRSYLDKKDRKTFDQMYDTMKLKKNTSITAYYDTQVSQHIQVLQDLSLVFAPR